MYYHRSSLRIPSYNQTGVCRRFSWNNPVNCPLLGTMFKWHWKAQALKLEYSMIRRKPSVASLLASSTSLVQTSHFETFFKMFYLGSSSTYGCILVNLNILGVKHTRIFFSGVCRLEVLHRIRAFFLQYLILRRFR